MLEHIIQLAEGMVKPEQGDSAAHGLSHRQMVGEVGSKIGMKLYGASEQEQLLIYLAGLGHDIVRGKTEDPNDPSAQQSADLTVQLMQKVEEEGYATFTGEEYEAAHYAVVNHSHVPQYLLDPSTKNRIPSSLADRIHGTLKIADDLAKMGPGVLERRAKFVGKERLAKEDLQQFGFRPERDEQLVVLTEGVVRFVLMTRADLYFPDALQLLVNALRDEERAFNLGLFKTLGLHTEEMAQLLFVTVNSKGQSIIDYRRKSLNKPVTTQAELLQHMAECGITDEAIDSLSDDTAVSASELVEYFTADGNPQVIDWQPQGEKAQDWKQGIIGYSDWLKNEIEAIGVREPYTHGNISRTDY